MAENSSGVADRVMAGTLVKVVARLH